MSEQEELLDKVQRVKNMLVERATNGHGDNSAYVSLRRDLIAAATIRSRLPSFIRQCGSLNEFWAHIKEKFAKWQERRNYLRDEFLPVITFLEGSSGTPSDQSTDERLQAVDSQHVRDAWAKALDRRSTDLGGAITAARTLIEAVCKHILDETQTPYEDNWELPRLYSETAKQLNLSPSQHSDEIFKQILSGCHSVVNGMAGLRNRFGDAHGKGKSGAKPASRHAELAVNLAGSMATFLISTWETRNEENREQK